MLRWNFQCFTFHATSISIRSKTFNCPGTRNLKHFDNWGPFLVMWNKSNNMKITFDSQMKLPLNFNRKNFWMNSFLETHDFQIRFCVLWKRRLTRLMLMNSSNKAIGVTITNDAKKKTVDLHYNHCKFWNKLWESAHMSMWNSSFIYNILALSYRQIHSKFFLLFVSCARK